MSAEQSILVTGAAGGIGTAVVLALLREHDRHGRAHIIAADLADAQDAADPIIERAVIEGIVSRCRLDVTDDDDVDDLLDSAGTRGILRAVVHVAGVLCTGPAVQSTPAEARRIFDVNALGTIRVLTASARAMLRQGAGVLGAGTRSLTTVASNAGNGPRAGFSVYGASKAAASSFTRSLGLEVGAAGIRCNVVSPGTTRTSMVTSMWDGDDRSMAAIEGDLGAYRTGVPLGRLADPDDIANVAEFLVSERARHITLADLSVDGGATQR